MQLLLSMFLQKVYTRILLAIALLLSVNCSARVDVTQFDSSLVIDAVVVKAATLADMDSVMSNHPMLQVAGKSSYEHFAIYDNKAFDLYVVLALIMMFGGIRYLNPRYFQYLQRAFRSPSFGNQQLKDQIGTAVLPNVLMNAFFGLSVGIYLFYVFKLSYPQRFSRFSPSVMMSISIAGLIGLYGAKFLVLRFSSWVFNIKPIVSHYLYNVFLINKILAIVVLPFIVVLAFAQHLVAYPAMIVSIFIVVALFISRYIRSWQVLGGFFQYNIFHFFAYLCASEILPMAILTKLLISGLFY